MGAADWPADQAGHQRARLRPALRPHWLHQRVNDPYGTPNRHPFWEGVSFEQIGPWRIFERDGAWWAYQTRQNAWSTARPSREDAVTMTTGRPVDIWA
jgi:hypothetical protein